MIDNYDSFTFNLFQYFGILGAKIDVVRNDQLHIKSTDFSKYNKIVISPGPGTPDNAGISMKIISAFKDKLPILGVCLGHQCIGQVFGSKIIRASKVMHGKTSEIFHNNNPIFKNIPSPFTATRYHSLVIEKNTISNDLSVIAHSDDGEIMGVKHKKYMIWGIQFHPESILTKYGLKILDNFLKL
jgi:anthranilate synthase/aminodeoxychorismate synthase-like glutamine amidotransferase